MDKFELMKLKGEFEKQFENQDDNFKKMMASLCDELNKFETEFLFKAEALRLLPYELAMLVVSKLEFEQDDYIGILNTFYYDEFIADTKFSEENGKKRFVNRYLEQKEENYRNYVDKRLLTLGEVDNLIKIVLEQHKETESFECVIKGYKGKNQQLKQLLKARKHLLQKENLRTNKTLHKKMGTFWLDVAKTYVEDCKKYKREI